jgi:hypothetical protein
LYNVPMVSLSGWVPMVTGTISTCSVVASSIDSDTRLCRLWHWLVSPSHTLQDYCDLWSACTLISLYIIYLFWHCTAATLQALALTLQAALLALVSLSHKIYEVHVPRSVFTLPLLALHSCFLIDMAPCTLSFLWREAYSHLD